MKFISIVAVLFLTSLTQASISVQSSTGLQIESSNLYYNFGSVGVNSRVGASYFISNTGNTFLQFSSANIWGAFYDAGHSCSRGIMPGQRCGFDINYWPANTGYHSGQFEIRFNGPTPNQEIIRVDLFGQGVWR